MAKVDLRKCTPGDYLLSAHGAILRYMGPLPKGSFYDHEVIYLDGGKGSRTHNGQVFKNNRLIFDHDIVKVLGPLDDESVKGYVKDFKTTLLSNLQMVERFEKNEQKFLG